VHEYLNKRLDNHAKDWYSTSQNIATFQNFEAIFLDAPRRLYIETALRRCNYPLNRILEVGCGTGNGLVYLLEIINNNDIEIIGVDPEQKMLSIAQTKLADKVKFIQSKAEDLPSRIGKFDLVLCHSNFRLWDDPICGLKRLESVLTNNGLCYILDLRKDIPRSLRENIVGQIDNQQYKDLYQAQLDAAYSLPEIEKLLSKANISNYNIYTGRFKGLGNIRTYTNAHSGVKKRLYNIFKLMKQHGCVPEASEVPVHLFVYPK